MSVIKLSEMPKDGAEYMGAGLNVDASRQEFGKLMDRVDLIAKGGYRVSVKSIEKWKCVNVSTTARGVLS